jgi:CheY-like chemotaxis protein
VSLHQVVEEAVELLAYHLRSDGVDVVMALADDVPALWADPHQLHQVVVNLVSNAHHAMRKSSPPRTITVTSRFEPARALVRLEVADTGPGVPPEVRSRIFDPFFTTKPTGEGTGLGLSLCQGIIEGHGGSIWLADSTGRGAVFVIELPVKETSAAVQNRAERDRSTPIGGRAILIIDDEPEILELLVDVLRADGHEVEAARSGASAMQKLRERTFDLVLSDVRMPGLDGAGLYRELEQVRPTLTRRFVFMTGDSLSAETRQFIEGAGALSLSKPFSPDEVRRVVRRALERAEPAPR